MDSRAPHPPATLSRAAGATTTTRGATKPPWAPSRQQQEQLRQKQLQKLKLQQQRRQQTQMPAFRRKVASANQTAICTTTSQKVGRRTLRQLMDPERSNSNSNKNKNNNLNNVREAYIVPIFQRRYCWTTVQWDTLWHDIVKRNSTKHSLGRLTCTTVPNHTSSQELPRTNIHRSVVIDGQQRFTTVTLILAAIRDALVALGNDGNDGPVRSIHRMLFLDPAAMDDWVATSDGNKHKHTIQEGLALDFCRLVPTFCDRSSYLAAILPPSAPQVQEFLAESFNPRWHRPLLAKQHYALAIATMLRPGQQEQHRSILAGLTRQLLDGLDLLYFPVDVDGGCEDGTEDTQVIYERLAIRDATWCKPRRKNEFRSMDGTDMIRNLLLGSFSSKQGKLGFYEHLWLPLERLYQTTGAVDDDDDDDSLRTILRAFLEQHHGSTTEEFRDDAPAAPSGVIGGRIYRDFETWMAKDWEGWQQQSPKLSKQLSSKQSLKSSQPLSPSEMHTIDVGRRLLEFARYQKQ